MELVRRPGRRYESAIGAPDLVDVIDHAVRAMAKHQHRHCVDDSPQLLLGQPGPLLGPLALRILGAQRLVERLQLPYHSLLLVARPTKRGRRPSLRRAQRHNEECRDAKEREPRKFLELKVE